MVLIILGIDGVISAIVGATFLNTRFGGFPVPVGPIISAVLNMALVWCALAWVHSPRWAGLPMWAFMVTTALLMFGGPGGDMVFTGIGALWLFLAGVLPAAWVLRRASFSAAPHFTGAHTRSSSQEL